MSAGDFMRRAVGNVSNTIAQASSTVTSVAQGRKRYDISDDAMEKCTLTIKCTPNKDAQTTTALSIKSGYLMKRNEQGQWQKRYLCTVPHLFLYYFDSDSADTPRGVIDLELYNNITRHKNTLKAATNNEEKMRAFHFMSEDGDQLNDWLAHFMRDRYFAVCEERNAYQQMQSEMTAVLDTISCQTKAVEIDKDIIEKQLQEALLAKQDAMGVLQSMLVIVGITEEDMSKLYDLNRIGHCLQTAIIRLKKEVETKYFAPDLALETEKAARAEEVAELNEKIELEIRARKNLEAMLLKQKKTNELQNAEYGSQIDTHLLNFQMMVACKAEADEKNVNLAEQRRLLIKEVKRARSKLTDTETSLESVESVNTKLTSAVAALQAELAGVKATLAEQIDHARVAQEESKRELQAAVSAAVVAALDAVRSQNENSQSDVTDAAEASASLLPVISASSSSSDTQDATSTALSIDTNTTTEPTQDNSETSHSAQNAQNQFISSREVELLLLESQAIVSKLQPMYNSTNSRQRRTSSGSAGSLSTSNSDSNLAMPLPAERYHSADSGTPQTPMDLKELGWLSPEQEKLVDSRIQLHQQQHPTVEAKYKYLDSSNSTAASDGEASSTEKASTAAESEAPSAASIAASSASAAASSTLSMFSGAMSMLSSTASATLHTATGHDESNTTVNNSNNSQKRAPKGIISSIFQSEKDKPEGEESEECDNEEEDPERLPSAMRLNCLRCAGTVEGPKYSTCKCSVPALVPEDLQPASSFSVASSGSWGFSGMLSKSSSAFVGGLAKASQVTQSNVESLMKAAKAAQSTSTSASESTERATKDKNTEGFMFYNSMVSTPAPTAAEASDAPAEGSSVDTESSSTTAPSLETPPEQQLWSYFMGGKDKESTHMEAPSEVTEASEVEVTEVEVTEVVDSNTTEDMTVESIQSVENVSEDHAQVETDSVAGHEVVESTPTSELNDHTAFI